MDTKANYDLGFDRNHIQIKGNGLRFRSILSCM